MQARYALVPDKEIFELHTEELDPAMLRRDQVLVRAETTMVSAGTELSAFMALSKNVYLPNKWNSYPWRPGYGLVGQVVAVHETESSLAVGQRVFCFGKHASLQIYDYAGDKPMNGIFAIESNLDAVKAAVARMVLVGLSGPQTSGVEPGDTVAVFGLGMVGNLAAQLYQLSGARVIGLDTCAGRVRAAREAGIAEAILSAPDEQVRAVMDLTRGEGVSIAVDSVGSSAVIQSAVAVCARQGRIVLLGSPRAPLVGNQTDAWNRIHMESLSVLGALEWRIPRRHSRGVRHSVESNLALAFDLLRNDKVISAPLVSHIVSPEKLGDAYRGMMADKDTYRGVVVDWR